MRSALPVKYSAGPLAAGWEPAMDTVCDAEGLSAAGATAAHASRNNETRWRRSATSSSGNDRAAGTKVAGMRMRIGWIVVALLLVFARPAISGQEASTMKIRLTVDGKAVEATLLDNATARDLLSLLPMTLTLEDYASTEKIGYPPRKLSTAGAPAGVDPSVGDIAYYAPWGNLAIFYKEFRYSRGLIGLGRIDSGIEALNVAGSLKVTIERVGK
jgi:hypothetical protein